MTNAHYRIIWRRRIGRRLMGDGYFKFLLRDACYRYHQHIADASRS